MKHAKKLLAVVMVLAMVAAFSAIAFAAPAVSFAVGEYADGKATVAVSFDGAVGLTSGSLSFAYPDGKVTKIVKKNGADAAAIGDIDNGFSSEFNNAANPAEFGFYFKNNLWSSAEWKEAADDLDQTTYVNGESFEAAQFVFTAEAGTTVTVTGELKIGDAVTAVETSFTIGAVAPTEAPTEAPKPTEAPTEAPKPTEAPTEAPKPTEAPTAKPTEKATQGQKGTILDIDPNNNGKDFVGGKTDEKATKADDKCTTAKADKTNANVKTDAGKNTGDNSVLAIVAGVVALAGAAYVVTKKRK